MSYLLFATTCPIVHQAPLSLGFSRQEYWSGLPFPSPGNLPSPGTEPRSSTLQADSSLSESSGKPKACQQFHFVYHDPNFTKYESLLNTLEGKKKQDSWDPLWKISVQWVWVGLKRLHFHSFCKILTRTQAFENHRHGYSFLLRDLSQM